MSTFERITHIDPSREISIEIENGRIEMSDQEYLARILNQRIALEEQLEIPLKKVDERKKDEKNKSKVLKKAPKKVHSKSNSSTVASIQK